MAPGWEEAAVCLGFGNEGRAASMKDSSAGFREGWEHTGAHGPPRVQGRAPESGSTPDTPAKKIA